MTEKPYVAVVERAQSGDLAAFAELVVAFQDLAVGTAFSWLREIERARDATQEAFLEAHLHLRELREPAAFPAWLRTLVVKHCDRVTRRPRAVLTPLDLAFDMPGPNSRFFTSGPSSTTRPMNSWPRTSPFSIVGIRPL